jgi:type VI secretion system protein ImpA
MSLNVDALLQPLAGDSPCGQNLEDTQLLASFDSFRTFGQATPLSPDIDWRAIAARANEALAQSKDIRPLTYLAAATIRTEGLVGFVQLLQAAAAWLKNYWKEVYPLVDDDAILRRNALNGFADPMAVLDALRRVPLVVNRQLGSINFRHTEIAAGRMNRAEGEGETPTEDQISAVFTAAASGELAQLDAVLADGLGAIKEISESMSAEGGGSQAVPDLPPLQSIFARLRVVIKPYLAVASEAGAEASGGAASAGAAGAAGVPGSIRTREDAIRALEAVATFFRTTEPSSPVPLFVERAKRLVAANFLDVLADVVPDAVSDAKRAGGIRDES